MTKQPSPRLDALRAMREQQFEKQEHWTERVRKRILKRALEDKTEVAIAKADDAANRRKAKKAKRASR